MLGGNFSEFRFADPWFLLLFLVIPILFFYQTWKQKHSRGGLRFPQVKLAKHLGSPWTLQVRKMLFPLRLAGISLLILGFARPQLGSAEEDISTEGVDSDCHGHLRQHGSGRLSPQQSNQCGQASRFGFCAGPKE